MPLSPVDIYDINLYIDITMLIPTSKNTKTVSHMRKDPIGLLKSVDHSEGPNYIFYRSTPRAVLLNIANYQKLVEMAEDYLDSLAGQEYEKRSKKSVIWLKQKDFETRLGLRE